MFQSTELVEFVESMVGMPYWYGTCVEKCTSSLLKFKSTQYAPHYTEPRMSKYHDAIEKNQVCADCGGLIKGFFWTNGGKGVLNNYLRDTDDFQMEYDSKGFPDKNANGMLAWCKSNGAQSGDISVLPEVPGILLFASGHVGVYVGNGYAVEARGFDYGIVKTRVASRTWREWAYLPASLLDYTGAASVPGKIETAYEPKAEIEQALQTNL